MHCGRSPLRGGWILSPSSPNQSKMAAIMTRIKAESGEDLQVNTAESLLGLLRTKSWSTAATTETTTSLYSLMTSHTPSASIAFSLRQITSASPSMFPICKIGSRTVCFESVLSMTGSFMSSVTKLLVCSSTGVALPLYPHTIPAIGSWDAVGH